MKKLGLLTLVVFLVCMLVTALAAEDFTIPQVEGTDGHDESFRSLVVDDTVRLLSTQRNLYTLNTTTQEITHVPIHNANPEYEQVPETALAFHKISKNEAVPAWLKKEASLIDVLFWDGAVLYGVNELNGTLYRVEITESEATLHIVASLDFFSEIDKECMPSIRSGVACNGELYLLMNLAADEEDPSVYRFDLTDGTRELLTSQNKIVEITRYLEKHLLFLEETSEAQWQVVDFDAATATRSTLYESSELSMDRESVFGLLYDPWRDRILIQADQELLSLVDRTSYKVIAYLPAIWLENRAIGEDGRLLLLNDGSIDAISTLQEGQLSKPLQVACNDWESWMEQGFTQTNPDIAVNHKQVYGHEAVTLLAEQITTQSDDIDIFEVPIGSASEKAIEKGYYYRLNQSKIIRDKVNAFRPFFQQAVMRGNDIVAIPRMVEQYTVAYSEYALDQLGLTASDMPKTFVELLDFLLKWDERVGDIARQTGITPFGNGLTNKQLKAELFRVLMDQYYVLMAKDASAIPRYEEEMANLLDQLSLVCTTIPEASEDEPYATTNERFSYIPMNDQPSYLFSIDGSFLPGRRIFSNGETVSDFIPITLTLPSQDVPLLLCDGTVFIVNPYSSHKEQAILWLSFYMNRLPAGDAAALNKEAMPIEAQLYQDMKAYYSGEIEKLEIRKQAAEEMVKNDLAAQIQVKQDQLHGLEQIKWEVSAQALNDYEQALDHCMVAWKDSYASPDSFNKTYAAYLAEGMSGKPVAHEFFAIHEMILKEAQ
ncbi:MAG: hypothetical protein RSI33_11765 [Clostridia bacterium]